MFKKRMRNSKIYLSFVRQVYGLKRTAQDLSNKIDDFQTPSLNEKDKNSQVKKPFDGGC